MSRSYNKDDDWDTRGSSSRDSSSSYYGSYDKGYSKDRDRDAKDDWDSKDSRDTRDSRDKDRDRDYSSRSSYSRDSRRDYDSRSSRDSYKDDSRNHRDSYKDDYYSKDKNSYSKGGYDDYDSKDVVDLTDPYVKATFGEQDPNTVQTYSEKAVDVEDLYKKANTGINFSKYDDIPVNCTGTNVPAPILSFEKSGLHPQVLDNVRKANYTSPTPVQKYAIPASLQGRDMMACAQTGSGKTAAFLLPGLSRMLSDPPTEKRPMLASPLFLVLAPTRELAIQIHEEARKFSYRTAFRPCVVYGGAPFGAQARDIDYGCDILIATPGRLIDMLERGKVTLNRVRHFCMDEADRMLDMGFEKQIRSIVEGNGMPGKRYRQTTMFSATFPKEVRQLASDFLNDHLFLKVGRVGSTTESITQVLKFIRFDDKKEEVLKDLRAIAGRTLVFTETKKDADVIARFLFTNGFSATAIHGDRSQREREAALNSFKAGRITILVATDVASRGLDISGVSHVVNYDMPNNIDSYVHRIGRTGRAGHVGTATSYFTDDNRGLAKKLYKILAESKQIVPDWLQKMASEPSFDKKGGRGFNGGRMGGGGAHRFARADPYGNNNTGYKSWGNKPSYGAAAPTSYGNNSYNSYGAATSSYAAPSTYTATPVVNNYGNNTYPAANTYSAPPTYTAAAPLSTFGSALSGGAQTGYTAPRPTAAAPAPSYTAQPPPPAWW